MNSIDITRWREVFKALMPLLVGVVAAIILLIKGEVEQALVVLALFGGTGGLVFGVKNQPPS